jgi:hypothetical protein
MSTREVTPQDIEAAYERVAYPCVRAYNLEGELEPCMTGFALGDTPGTLLDESVPMPRSLMQTMFSQSEQRRQAMVRRFVGELLIDGSTLRDNLPRFNMPKPSLVVLACEGWMAEEKIPGGLRDEVRKVGGVKNLPGRIECIMLFVHTVADTFMGFCPIADKHASLGPLLPGQFDGRGRVEGPMTTGPLTGLDGGEVESWSSIKRRESS